MRQLSASQSNSSRLNCSSPLTNSRTHQPTDSTPLTVLLVTSRHGLHRKRRSTVTVCWLLPNNEPCIVVCFAVVAYQRIYMPQYFHAKCEVVPMLNQLSTMPWKHIRGWRYYSTIIEFDSRWTSVVSFTPRPLLPWENLPIHIGKKAGWVPGPVWTLWRRDKSCPLGKRTPAVTHRYPGS
jgi:hypothetical protein